jgi:asparagine synthase (glutamine-hydrolysing)
MCGICGQYNRYSGRPDQGMLKRMADSLYHRGPDDEGYYFSGPLGLGFRRLSIIDLSKGHQPMSDIEKSIWVVFNGEIYNFLELKKELEKLGHIFKTNCDTEVIIHGYKQWGIDILNRLNGMFGLAIWDEIRKKLFIARDPMGIKVVYYTITKDKLIFASEVRAILTAIGGNHQINPISLNLFLRYRYTPSPYTLFSGIKKLSPGSMLIVENGNIKELKWYNFSPSPLSKMPSDHDVKEELLHIYKNSVKRHLLSDVPLGLLLSGGIDSGLLLGLMNLEGSNWKTYTIGYGDTYVDDELKDARETAEIFKSNHTSILLEKEKFESALPKIVSFLEEPVASSSIVPMYFVCERARQDVKVALIGQGPDELFGGYKRHLGVHYGAYYRYLPDWIRFLSSISINALPRNETFKRGVYSLDEKSPIKRYQNVFSLLPGSAINSLFKSEMLSSNPGDEILSCWEAFQPNLRQLDELGRFQFIELRSSLPDELLMYADKLSMAHSLEVRVPYLDKEVVEFVQQLPSRFKIRRFNRKWLHKKVCHDFLPKQIIKRRKRGFGVTVVDRWFKESMNSKMNSYLQDDQSLMYEYLKPSVVNSLLRDHVSGRNDNHKILFSLVVFEEWLRTLK